ncbi:hypothetical protein ACJX0J_012271, partial [Zea mays]
WKRFKHTEVHVKFVIFGAITCWIGCATNLPNDLASNKYSYEHIQTSKTLIVQFKESEQAQKLTERILARLMPIIILMLFQSMQKLFQNIHFYLPRTIQGNSESTHAETLLFKEEPKKQGRDTKKEVWEFGLNDMNVICIMTEEDEK